MREQKVQDGLNETEGWRKRRWDADGVEKNECSGEKNNKGRIAEGGKWSKPSQGFCQRLRADSKETGVNLITHSAISSEHKQKLWKKTVGICHYFTYCFWEGLRCLETGNLQKHLDIPHAVQALSVLMKYSTFWEFNGLIWLSYCIFPEFPHLAVSVYFQLLFFQILFNWVNGAEVSNLFVKGDKEAIRLQLASLVNWCL